jgi:hypothetical protein
MNVMKDGLNCTAFEWAYLNSNAVNLTRHFEPVDGRPYQDGEGYKSPYGVGAGNPTCELLPATEYFQPNEAFRTWYTGRQMTDNMLSSADDSVGNTDCSVERMANATVNTNFLTNRACCYPEYAPTDDPDAFKDGTRLGVCDLVS